MEQLVSRLWKNRRVAIVLLSAVIQAGLGRIVVHIVRGKDVQPAVPVLVAKRDRGSPSQIRDSLRLRHVDKPAAPIVHEQMVGSEITHVQIGISVVGHVSSGDARCELGTHQPRLVGELSVVPLPVKMAVRRC